MKIKVVSLIPLRKRQLLREQVKTTYGKTVGRKVSKDDVKIIIFSEIKAFNSHDFKKQFSENEKKKYMIGLLGLIEELTPREFTRLFPIDKRYDGNRYETKDYFSTVEYINSIGWDTNIDSAIGFLMEYMCHDTMIFTVTAMGVIERYGGTNAFENIFGVEKGREG